MKFQELFRRADNEIVQEFDVNKIFSEIEPVNNEKKFDIRKYEGIPGVKVTKKGKK
jgi:hypothetical protein